jgi:hypothetical protein
LGQAPDSFSANRHLLRSWYGVIELLL